MNNPFDLKSGDMVICVNEKSRYLGLIFKIKNLDVFKSRLWLFTMTEYDDYQPIEDFEPIVRVSKPKPIFVPKFRKGDKIKSNERCEYNQGTYTCYGNSFIGPKGIELVCVEEIYSALNVDWFDKVEEKPVPPFVPKIKKGQQLYFKGYSSYNEKADKNYVVEAISDSFIKDNREQFKGKIIKYGDTWFIGKEHHFYTDVFEPVVFEPTFKKDQIVTYYYSDSKDYFVVQVLEDSRIPNYGGNERGNEQFTGIVTKTTKGYQVGYKVNDWYVSRFKLGEPFEPKFKKDEKATFYDANNRKSCFTVLVLEDSDKEGKFKGKVIKTNDFSYWPVGSICDSFVVEKFELGEPPFEPKVKKGQQLYFIGDDLGTKPDKNYIVEATSDSFMSGEHESFKAKIINNPSLYISGPEVNYYIKCFAPRIPTFEKGDKFINGIYWYEANEDSWFSNGNEWVRGVDSVMNHLVEDCTKIELISDADGLKD